MRGKRISPRLPRRRAGSRRSSGVTAPNGRSGARPAQRIKTPKLKPLVPSTPEHVKQSPKQKIKAPRAAAPAAACVAGRSTGQHMLPQQPSKQTATAPPLNLCRSQAPLGNASREAPLRIPAPAIAPGTNTAPAARRACLSIGIPGGFFHTLSRGQHMPPQQALKTNGNSAPHKTAKTKSALILACPAAGRGRVAPAA